MISDPFAWFWMLMILASILWYTVLLGWLGVRGGREIVRMARLLGGRPRQDAAPVPRPPEP